MSVAPGERNLAVLAEDALQRKGEYRSLSFEDEWATNRELHERARALAVGLRELGLQPGDRVAVLMMNVPEVLVTYTATWRAGGVATPIIFLQTPPELRHILENSGARFLVVTPELLPLFNEAAEGLDITAIVVGDDPAATEEPTPNTFSFSALESSGARLVAAGSPEADIVPRADDDIAALLYTGGTTGRAKGVMLSHGGLYATGHALAEVRQHIGGDTTLVPLPLSHAYGLNVAVSDWVGDDQTITILQRWFDAKDWLSLAEKHQAQGGPLVPSMMSMIMAEDLDNYDLSSLTSLGSGGAPLPEQIRLDTEAALGVEIYQGYGCTEVSSAATACHPDARRVGSVGRALPGVEVSIIDSEGRQLGPDAEGEVVVGGKGVMLGYWNDPEMTQQTMVDGMVHTGDIGKMDHDGFLYLIDRKKDLIIRGGFNVYPRDVEDTLLTHPEVTAAAVVGRPDSDKGEEVVAAVSLVPEAEVTAAELIDYCAARLARYKYPRDILIVDAVPVTSMGKTDRKKVRSLVVS